ncbi:MAG: hypothetical protein ACPGWR_32715, partial [Ardenticatenaceae bacterium]
MKRMILWLALCLMLLPLACSPGDAPPTTEEQEVVATEEKAAPEEEEEAPVEEEAAAEDEPAAEEEASEATYELNLGVVTPTEHPHSISAREFASLVAEK